MSGWATHKWSATWVTILIASSFPAAYPGAPENLDAGVLEVPQDHTGLDVLAERLTGELESRRADVMAAAIAASAFEAQVSRPAVQLTAAQLDEVAPIVRRATIALSGADLAAAEVELRALGVLRDAALEDLNRDINIARRALDGCLLGVRARLDEDSTGALTNALSCVRDHPRIVATTGYHPPEVRAVYAEAERQLSARGSAELSIEIPPLPRDNMGSARIPSQGPRCISRINGVRVGGHPPVLIPDLRPGLVRLQLECFDHPSRVHYLRLEPGENPVPEMRIPVQRSRRGWRRMAPPEPLT